MISFFQDLLILFEFLLIDIWVLVLVPGLNFPFLLFILNFVFFKIVVFSAGFPRFFGTSYFLSLINIIWTLGSFFRFFVRSLESLINTALDSWFSGLLVIRGFIRVILRVFGRTFFDLVNFFEHWLHIEEMVHGDVKVLFFMFFSNKLEIMDFLPLPKANAFKENIVESWVFFGVFVDRFVVRNSKLGLVLV